ncbi:MAG: glycosyltransferase [Treponema sp.]|nr:glycosyltransferase [Treponema sp.]
MDLYDFFRYGHGIILIIIHIAIMLGIFLEWKRGKHKNQTEEAQVSLIIPIHNESTRIGKLLKTLINQSYNAQIIFIDDRSNDESPSILAQFLKDTVARGIDCRIITLTENPGPNFKQFALSKGIAEANGDYFLFTDGDCEVPPDWIRVMVNRIQDEKTGAVIGPVLKKKRDKGFLSLFQCYDHVLRYDYLAGATGLGAAGGGFGNNLIISRKALESVGGYEAIPSSLTEDAALISEIRSTGKYNIRAITSSNAAVETEPEKTWKSFINQTLRWNNGGLFSPEALTRLNFNILTIIIGTGILIIPLLPFIPSLWPLSAGVFVSMILNTIMAFGFFGKNLSHNGSHHLPGYFICLLFMPVYFTMINIMGYLKIKTTWKNEVLKTNKA